MNIKNSYSKLLPFVLLMTLSTSLVAQATTTNKSATLKPVTIKQTQQHTEVEAGAAAQRSSVNSAAKQTSLVKGRYLVEFHEPPLARQIATQAKGAGKKAFLKSARATELQKQLKKVQKGHIASIKTRLPELKVHQLHQTLFNGAMCNWQTVNQPN